MIHNGELSHLHLVQTHSDSLTQIDCSYLAVVSEHLGDTRTAVESVAMSLCVMSPCGILSLPTPALLQILHAGRCRL